MGREKALTEISVMTIRAIQFPRCSEVFGAPINVHTEVTPE